MMHCSPAISVIIPTLNEERNIERCVRSVANVGELIVADGGSEDGTTRIACDLNCRVVHSCKGRGGQLRRGADVASGEILLFLHADSWLAAGALAQLRELAPGSGRIFGAFSQVIEDPRFRFRLLERGNVVRASWLRMPYGDQAMFVDRQSYEEVGGFPSVPLMEDVIIVNKLRRLCQPTLLPGPVHLSARRWQRRGVLRQTAWNWFILGAFRCGVSPVRLAKWYG